MNNVTGKVKHPITNGRNAISKVMANPAFGLTYMDTKSHFSFVALELQTVMLS
jgi:hypothetical protein